MILRSYQYELVDKSDCSDNVLIQADTGSGKTPILAEIAKRNTDVLFLVHRNILVKQASKVMAVNGIHHDIIATQHTRRLCISEHRKHGVKEGMICNARKYVCSIDSLLSRHRRNSLKIDVNKEWVIIIDEAHHMIEKNKWGKLTKIFKNSRFIGATATPYRLDGESLSAKRGGIFDRMIQSDELKDDSCNTLIKKGYLSDFKVFSIQSCINESNLVLGEYDYTYRSLNDATKAVVYEMAGNAVKHYKKIANNKLALGFCPSIQIAEETAKVFRKNKIPAASIHSEMTSVEIDRIFKMFESRQINVLFNVDMFGEGTDVPAIEALIMMRKTASLAMCRQFFGRALRPSPGKDHAIIIDHVGNALTHGLPDRFIKWDLENPPASVKTSLIACEICRFVQSAWNRKCEECGCELHNQVDFKRDSDVKYIDYNLVEIQRRKLEAEFKEENVINVREKSNQTMLAPGILGKKINELRVWCSDVLESNDVDVKTINRFFSTTSTSKFWINNFKASDLNSNNDKVMRVFKKWQK